MTPAPSLSAADTCRESIITDLAERLRVQPHGSTTLTTKALAAIEHAKEINAFVTITQELAHAQAEASDARHRTNRPLSEIDGIPVAVKDNFCVKGTLTSAGSKILSNFIAPYESTVTQLLREAGAVFLGKTNMDEFGMGSSTEKSFFGATKNPLALELNLGDYVPGGSSGGSAAAVAAGICAAAIGTDTGGSIRQPASFCGLVGMKPTYGMCSRYGIVAYASSLEQAGVITRTVEDAAILLDLIMKEDPKDSTSLPYSGPSLKASLTHPARIRSLAIPQEFLELELGQDLKDTWTAIFLLSKRAGFETKVVSIPALKYALASYYVIAISEASSNLSRYDGVRFGYRASNAATIEELYKRTRAEGFGREVRKRIIIGTYFLSAGYYDAYYLKAQKLRRLLAQEMLKALDDSTALIWPTTPTAAFPIGQYDATPAAMYLEDIFTVPVNLAGMPALTLPVAYTKMGMALGATIAGRLMGDADVISVARELEAVRHH
ncbi:Asp-tRNA(Asn)/Glu-tRNA(Gln) amidotransferase subunit GatA [Thiohalocapsa sp. ML1]|uniref:Asp-tRNA(Asn)/Glu-tRNA(Gln) amidotransferase subunit GatA n=1 Tax=Thiohalocapsa sp. ML1 TaxID=1431688 RepID=UPI0009EBD27C|nr:Asp-tRNA(Asn)/Glu-tRNA(Gln) amidotransferase subunit GatA [Thiohalocapsa sp. ML1]